MALSNSLNPDFSGSVGVQAGTNVPAGGATGKGLLLSNTSNLGVFFGSGAPTLTLSAGRVILPPTP